MKLFDLPQTECPHCNGTGKALNHSAIGRQMRDLRKSKSLSVREIARRMGLSAAYVSDLELGRRAWSAKRIADYLNETRNI